jgi:dsRNA-specific ribonuclease
MFRVEVVFTDHAIPGAGSTIKAAEMDAAHRALEQLNLAPQPEASQTQAPQAEARQAEAAD